MVYVVTMVDEEEYCGRTNVGVYATRALAQAFIDAEGDPTFEHWSGRQINIYSVEEWEVVC